MTDKMSWHKGKKGLAEESAGDGKHGRKKRERLFKKRFSQLSLFSGSPKNKVPQGRSPPAEEQRRRRPRRGCRRPQEEPRPRRPQEEPRPRRPQEEPRPRRPQEEPRPRRPQEEPRSRRPQEEPCSLARQRCGKMCPSCEILLCRPCGTLHSQRGFIAHSLLDHYDSAAAPR